MSLSNTEKVAMSTRAVNRASSERGFEIKTLHYWANEHDWDNWTQTILKKEETISDLQNKIRSLNHQLPLLQRKLNHLKIKALIDP